MPVRLRRPSPALVLAAVALFVALGGPAQARKLLDGGDIRRGTVTSKQVADRGLKTRDLSRNTVRKLRTPPFGSVGGRQIKDSSIGAADLLTGAVTAPALAPDSVVSNSVVDGSLRGMDLGGGTIESTHIGNGQVRKPDIGTGAVGASEIQPGAVAGSEVLDGSLAVADLAVAQGTGTFGDLEPPLAAGTCTGVPSPAAQALPEGETLLDDVILPGRAAGWPGELALRAQPLDAGGVEVFACNTGKAPVEVAGLGFRWIALAG